MIRVVSKRGWNRKCNSSKPHFYTGQLLAVSTRLKHEVL